MYTTKSFEYILAVAENSSISEAAESLGIAQSALSRYIIKLEKDLGVELFDRTSIPIVLTEAGRYFVDAGRQILAVDRQLEKRLEDVKTHNNQEIRIGIGPSRAPVLHPLIIREFAATHPDVCVRLYECRTAELAERLKDGKLDLIITFDDYTTEGFGMEELFEEKVELAVPSVFVDQVEAVMKDDVVDIRQIHAPFISLHAGQQLRNALDILGEGKIKPLYTSEYQESAMALVSNGFGIALTPSYWKLVGDNDDISYYPISVPDNLTPERNNSLMSVIHRKICIFYVKEQFLTNAEKAYIRAAKEVCRSIQ